MMAFLSVSAPLREKKLIIQPMVGVITAPLHMMFYPLIPRYGLERIPASRLMPVQYERKAGAEGNALIKLAVCSW
jgi:hypothetical protein